MIFDPYSKAPWLKSTMCHPWPISFPSAPNCASIWAGNRTNSSESRTGNGLTSPWNTPGKAGLMDAGLVKEICLRSTPWPITLLQEQHPESSHGMREQRELRDCLRSSLAAHRLTWERVHLGVVMDCMTRDDMCDNLRMVSVHIYIYIYTCYISILGFIGI